MGFLDKAKGFLDKAKGKCKECGASGVDRPLVLIMNVWRPYWLCFKCIVERGRQE